MAGVSSAEGRSRAGCTGAVWWWQGSAGEVTPGSAMARAGSAREIQLQLLRIHSRLSIQPLIILPIFHRYKSPKFLTFPVQQEIQELITSPSDSTKVSNVWLSTTLIQLYLYSLAAYKEFSRNSFLILLHITVKVKKMWKLNFLINTRSILSFILDT